MSGPDTEGWDVSVVIPIDDIGHVILELSHQANGTRARVKMPSTSARKLAQALWEAAWVGYNQTSASRDFATGGDDEGQ